MGNFNQLMGLMQQVSALMDDIGRLEILSVGATNDGKVRVHLSSEAFFNNFRGFKIECRSERRKKFRVSKVVQGVEFYAITNDLSELKITKHHLINGHKKSLRALQCG